MIFIFVHVNNGYSYSFTQSDYKIINHIESTIENLLNEKSNVTEEKIIKLLSDYNTTQEQRRINKILNVIIAWLEHRIEKNLWPALWEDYFWIENEVLFFYDYEFNYKKYFPDFDVNNVSIITDHFFVYNNTELYSSIWITADFYDTSIHLVDSDIDVDTLKVVTKKEIFDITKVYTWWWDDYEYISEWDYNAEKRVILWDWFMTCLDTWRSIYYDELLIHEWSFALYKNEWSVSTWAIGCKNISNPEFDNPADVQVLNESYVKTKRHVYYVWGWLYIYWNVMSSVDLTTFEILDYSFSKDKNNIYYKKAKLDGLDISSIKIIDENVITDGKVTYYKSLKTDSANTNFRKIWKDFVVNDEGVFYVGAWSREVEWADPETFEEIWDALWKDKDSVYFWYKDIYLDPNTVEVLSWWYYKDDEKVVNSWYPVYWSDAKTFVISQLNPIIAMDKENVFYYKNKQYWVDARTFEMINGFFWKDSESIYFLGAWLEKIEWVDPESVINVLDYDKIQIWETVYQVIDSELHIDWENTSIEEELNTKEIAQEEIYVEDEDNNYTKKIEVLDSDSLWVRQLKEIGQSIIDNFDSAWVRLEVKENNGKMLLSISEKGEVFMNLYNVREEVQNISLVHMKTILSSAYPHLDFVIDSEKNFIESSSSNSYYNLVYYNGLIIDQRNLFRENTAVFDYLYTKIQNNEWEILVRDESKPSFIYVISDHGDSDREAELAIKWCIFEKDICVNINDEPRNFLGDFLDFHQWVTLDWDSRSGYDYYDRVYVYYDWEYLLALTSMTKLLTEEDIRESLEVIYNEILTSE